MISKKDWHRFVHRVNQSQRKLKNCYQFKMTIKDNEVLSVDSFDDIIVCNLPNNDPSIGPTTITYKHPDSFRENNPSFKAILSSLRVDVRFDYNDLKKLTKDY